MAADTLAITTLQGDIHWENKAANLDMWDSILDELTSPAEIVVLPEMFTTGFTMQAAALAEPMDGPTMQWMADTAAQLRVILTGSFIARENDSFFNRLVWMLPNGQFGYYDKRHLFTLAGEEKIYTPGNKRLIASAKGWKLNLQVCYDLRFPTWARQQVSIDEAQNPQPEYDVLVYVANWPERRNHAWKTLLSARAIENQCYVVGVNRVGKDGWGVYHSGDSMVVDPLGGILYHRAHEPELNTVVLERKLLDENRSRLPFWRDGDAFTLLP